MQSTYGQRADRFATETEVLQKKYSRLGSIRLFVFLGAIAGAIWAFAIDQYALGWSIIPTGIVSFLIIVKAHERVKQRLDRSKELRNVNLKEIQLQEYKFSNLDLGTTPDPLHPYESDLDLFGNHSLFQLLNRTSTVLGKSRLIEWLRVLPSRDETEQRQGVVKSLINEIDWRQEFEATGRLFPDTQEDINNLRQWQSQHDLVTSRTNNILRFAGPTLAGLLVAAYFIGLIPGIFASVGIIVNFVILARIKKPLMEMKTKAESQSGLLKKYYNLFLQIEQSPFPSLQQYRDVLNKNSPASLKTKKLFKIYQNLDASNNPVWMILGNGLFLWDMHFAFQLQAWKKENAEDINNWISAMADVEALCSIAGLALGQPQWTFPSFEGELAVNATQLGHPMINSKDRVSNNVSFGSKGQVGIITGSNMSGKSTFLRTIGLNLVLARLGAPVCAESMSCKAIDVFTSMRTQDSLEEQTSSFYAELKRIKQLIEISSSNTNIFYLLDEILKGTNSEDRHLGAKALAKQMHEHGTLGFISTHDLELGNLPEELGSDNCSNLHFTSNLIDGKLHFDYKLKAGICPSFNAYQLMSQMGIKMDRAE